MKKHQENFLSAHGSPEHINQILGSSDKKYHSSIESNPNYDVTNLRNEINRNRRSNFGWMIVHKADISKLEHTKEDVDGLIRGGKYHLAATSPHFDSEHLKMIFRKTPKEVPLESYEKVHLDGELKNMLFGDDSRNFRKIGESEAFWLAKNKSLHQEGFDKLFDHANDMIYGELVKHHPDKVRPEHIQKILDHDEGRKRSSGYWALKDKGLI